MQSGNAIEETPPPRPFLVEHLRRILPRLWFDDRSLPPSQTQRLYHTFASEHFGVQHPCRPATDAATSPAESSAPRTVNAPPPQTRHRRNAFITRSTRRIVSDTRPQLRGRLHPGCSPDAARFATLSSSTSSSACAQVILHLQDMCAAQLTLWCAAAWRFRPPAASSGVWCCRRSLSCGPAARPQCTGSRSLTGTTCRAAAISSN